MVTTSSDGIICGANISTAIGHVIFYVIGSGNTNAWCGKWASLKYRRSSGWCNKPVECTRTCSIEVDIGWICANGGICYRRGGWNIYINKGAVINRIGSTGTTINGQGYVIRSVGCIGM